MNLFRNNNDSTESETDNSEAAEVVEKEAKYTEHTATAVWMDGGSEEFVFDSLDKSDGSITLKNYTGAYVAHQPMIGDVKKFNSEAIVTIPFENLKKFETTEREKKSITYEVEK